MESAPLVRTPKQVAELLGISMPALRRHAATLEDITGQTLPRGEHLERLWPEASVEALQAALRSVRQQEHASIGDALRAQFTQPEPLLKPQGPALVRTDMSDELRALIREELRVVVREEMPVVIREELKAIQGDALPPASTPSAPLNPDEMRDLLRAEIMAALSPERLRVVLHSAQERPAPPAPQGFMDRLLWLLKR